MLYKAMNSKSLGTPPSLTLRVTCGFAALILLDVLQELFERLAVDPGQRRLQLTQTLRVHRGWNTPEIEKPDSQSWQLGLVGNLWQMAMDDFATGDGDVTQTIDLRATEVERR